MASAAATRSALIEGNNTTIEQLAAVRAPFVLRCAALTIDYLILLILPTAWLVTGKLISDTGTVVIGGWVWAVSIILFLGNFVVLPLLRGRTIGKILLGLTIVRTDGSPLTLLDVLKRNVLGYLLTLLTAGLGFLIGAVNTSGRSLHDFVAGTIVIRGRRTPLN